MTKILIDRATVEQALEALWTSATPKSEDAITALRAALAEPVQEPDLSRCPKCNGPADNGHDREVPPNLYVCTKCMAEPVQEPVQEPFALPCPTPKACKAHCCSGHCVPRTNHQNDMTRIPPMLCIPHRIPDCPKCMSTHTAPPQRKPLTDEEIDEVWNSLIATPDFSRVKIARAIERAHGIGGEA